ncbi:MAG TPA: MFS transporter [Synergistaceae bacterium]|nr:MFS transporter [Synergistaceae bacterium]
MDMDRFIDEVAAEKDWFRALVVTGLAWGFVASGVMAFSFALPGIIEEWGLSGAQGGVVAGKTFFGMLLGALLGGWFADLWGRRLLAAGLTLLGCLGGIACIFAKTPESLGWWRFVAGISYGGLGPVLFSYLCDFTKSINRGRVLVFLEMCWAFGSLGMAFWAVGVLSFLGWRGVLAFPVLLGVVALPLWFGPESPRYLFAKGKKQPLLDRYGQVPATMESLPSHAWLDLFRGEFARKTLVLLFLWAVVSFGYYALFLWLPKIFALSGIDVIKARWFTLFVMAVQVPGYLLAAWLVERWGRVRSLTFFFAGTGGASLLFLGVRSSAGFLVAALGVGLFCLGAWGVVYAYTPELYPTSLRGSASGLSGASARLAGMVAPVLTGWMLDGHGGVMGVLSLVCILSLGAAGVVFFWGEETRRRSIG